MSSTKISLEGDEEVNRLCEDGANMGRIGILERLLLDNVISEAQFIEYKDNYAFVVKKPSIKLFSKLFKILSKDNEIKRPVYVLVKDVSPCNENTDEEGVL